MLRTLTLHCTQQWSNECRAALHALRLPESATQSAVKTKYRKLAMRCHPDRGGSREAYEALRSEYEVLIHWFGAEEGTQYNASTLHTREAALRIAIDAQDRTEFTSLFDDTLSSPWLLCSVKLLYIMIEGAALKHSLGVEHTQSCVACIAQYESIAGVGVTADVFNAVLYPYAFMKKTDVLADGVMLAKCVTFIAEAMQERSINVEAEWWTKRLIDKVLKSSGKFSEPAIVDEDAPASWLEARRGFETGK